ncbi:MAG: glycosyltransferase family 2 protein [Bacteroidales bacterium]|nr:glycosyltransferase family 2 protein [Bacteroidales bacterium]
MAKVAVVILNWNGREFLRKFLPSVLAHSQDVAEVIIADNASTDSSIEFLQDNYPRLRIIINRSNGGFARGYNEALSEVEADYFVLLNSDIEVTENWIEPVISLMESDKMIAACQPKLRSFQEREKFEYAGAAGGFIDEYGYPFCRGRIFQHLETDNGQYNDAMEIFWATGACMFVRADLYKMFGGFDEDFFAHMEEIDFCWRLKNGGYKIMYCPDSVVYHVGGGTLPKKSSHKTYLNFRNNLSLLYKNLPSHLVFPVFLVRFPLDGIAALKFLIDGGFADFYAVLRAHFYFYRHFFYIRSKRKKITQSMVHGIYKGNLVKEYYLNKKTLFTQLDPKEFAE